VRFVHVAERDHVLLRQGVEVRFAPAPGAEERDVQLVARGVLARQDAARQETSPAAPVAAVVKKRRLETDAGGRDSVGVSLVFMLRSRGGQATARTPDAPPSTEDPLDRSGVYSQCRRS